jgi:hypothetical protein
VTTPVAAPAPSPVPPKSVEEVVETPAVKPASDEVRVTEQNEVPIAPNQEVLPPEPRR